MAEIHSLLGLVERILERIEDGTLREDFQEPIQRGSASGYVGVVREDEEHDSLLLVVRLGIMKVPTGAEEGFFGRLLGLNHEFQGRAAFSVREDGTVCLTAGRPVEDLDPGEIIDLILWTSEQADDYDDILLTEFGYEFQL
jgi:hypothetical protein